MDDNAVVQAVIRRPVIAGCLQRVATAWPRPLTAGELYDPAGITAIANETLLTCLLKSIWVCHAWLEHLLTRLRLFLLERAAQDAPDSLPVDEKTDRVLQRAGAAKSLTTLRDFYSTGGCRDLLLRRRSAIANKLRRVGPRSGLECLRNPSLFEDAVRRKSRLQLAINGDTDTGFRIPPVVAATLPFKLVTVLSQ